MGQTILSYQETYHLILYQGTLDSLGLCTHANSLELSSWVKIFVEVAEQLEFFPSHVFCAEGTKRHREG